MLAQSVLIESLHIFSQTMSVVRKVLLSDIQSYDSFGYLGLKEYVQYNSASNTSDYFSDFASSFESLSIQEKRLESLCFEIESYNKNSSTNCLNDCTPNGDVSEIKRNIKQNINNFDF